MLNCKDIIAKHYALGTSGTKTAKSLKVSKSEVNGFLRTFREYPVPSTQLSLSPNSQDFPNKKTKNGQ